MHFLLLRVLVPFLLLLLVFATPRLEKVISEKEDRGQPLPSDVGSQSILPLDLRSLKDWKLTDLLLVSDIDGNLHGVERNTGAFLWSLPINEPLVRILKQERPGNESGRESNLLWLVEPYQDGSLYYFTPQYGLNKLPTSIKHLVMDLPFSLTGDDKIYTGARHTSLYTINVRTGEVVNQFGTPAERENCPVPNIYRGQNSEEQNPDHIMIGKTTFQLSIHSKDDASVMWNVTYSQWGPNNLDNDLIIQNVQSLDNQYFTPFHDKSLLAINKSNGTPSWISKLPSLAVNVFDVFNSIADPNNYVALPHPLKVLNRLQVNDGQDYANNDLCFINKTASGKEWFAMSFENYPTLLKSAPVSQYQMALYKYENGMLDLESVEHLKDLNVNEEDIEGFVNGVHRIYHLQSDNQFQPVTKFAADSLRRIGDGSQDSSSSVESDRESKQIPSLMDGILFPNTRDQPLDLSTIDHQDVGLVYNRGSYYTDLPVKYYDEPKDNGSKTHRESLSVFRRIAEDLFVMSALLMFLFGINKLNQILKSNKERGRNAYSASAQEKGSAIVATHLDKSLPEIPSDTKGSTEEENSEDTLTEKSNEKVQEVSKKVAFIDEDESKVTETSVDGSVGEEGVDDADVALVSKKKRKRGSRGGKRGGKGRKAAAGKVDDSARGDVSDDGKDDRKSDDDDNESDEEPIQTTSLVKTFTKPAAQSKKLQIDNNLVISDKILGYGSHGTVVYEGTFENRPVAVKRMLLDFYDIANHEVRLLQESDDHPNVIRYFCSQSSEQEKFLYIALELCACSLEDIVEKLTTYPKSLWIDHTTYCGALHQLVSGLNYLHSLKIVHRDLKPQNILVGETSNRTRNKDVNSLVRLLISDFGLCKKLDQDQSSFRATTQHAASGTSGWRAPELLLHHDLLEISPDTVSSINSASKHSIKDSLTAGSGQGKRLTKAIDIFSLGCVFYYILSGGGHPFGDRYLREGNIIRGEYDLSGLKTYCPRDYVEATDLISSMISFNPKLRPDTAAILKHPYFWDMNKKLEFLLKVSDRFEIERRDPPSDMLLTLEKISLNVHGGDWLSKFDDLFNGSLLKYRKYSTEKVMDLLRALRNKYHHFNDMPPDLQVQMSPLPHGFYKYFNDKFPNLLMETYYVVKENLHDEHLFQPYL